MISFGTGGALCPELFLPLEKYDFPYSKQNGKTYAVPWCRGNYMFFTLDGDFTDMTAENTVISEGNYSMALVAAACESLAGGQAKSSVSAYVDFLNGKYKYLFGTQRDVARLNTRGAAYTAKPCRKFFRSLSIHRRFVFRRGEIQCLPRLRRAFVIRIRAERFEGRGHDERLLFHIRRVERRPARCGKDFRRRRRERLYRGKFLRRNACSRRGGSRRERRVVKKNEKLPYIAL